MRSNQTAGDLPKWLDSAQSATCRKKQKTANTLGRRALSVLQDGKAEN